MKLAEALQLRSDLQTRISQLESRLQMSASVQEGEKPPENPEKLLKELNTCLDEFEKLVSRINKTNAETHISSGTLTELLSKRDRLKLEIRVYSSLADAAENITRRATRSEIKILSTVDVEEIRKKCDNLSKSLRETDTEIQSANWTTELL